MQIYGTSQNVEAFNKYGLRILVDAKMDYMKALKPVEVFLGEVFRSKVKDAGAYQLFDTEIDKYRRLHGESIIKTRIRSYIGRELGRMIQKIYLPRGSERWREMERILGYRLDYNDYHSRITGNQYCPAEENAADIFDHAVNGAQKITLIQINEYSSLAEVSSDQQDPQLKRKRISFDPHCWRQWFYGLWGQKYEWGFFNEDDNKGIANGLLHFFEKPPQVIDKVTFVPVRDLLEAHGFSINYKKGRFEYWR